MSLVQLQSCPLQVFICKALATFPFWPRDIQKGACQRESVAQGISGWCSCQILLPVHLRICDSRHLCRAVASAGCGDGAAQHGRQAAMVLGCGTRDRGGAAESVRVLRGHVPPGLVAPHNAGTRRSRTSEAQEAGFRGRLAVARSGRGMLARLGGACGLTAMAAECRFDRHTVRLAAVRALPRQGTRISVSRAMMPMTTNNSTSVNPCFPVFPTLFEPIGVGRAGQTLTVRTGAMTLATALPSMSVSHPFRLYCGMKKGADTRLPRFQREGMLVSAPYCGA